MTAFLFSQSSVPVSTAIILLKKKKNPNKPKNNYKYKRRITTFCVDNKFKESANQNVKCVLKKYYGTTIVICCYRSQFHLYEFPCNHKKVNFGLLGIQESVDVEYRRTKSGAFISKSIVKSGRSSN